MMQLQNVEPMVVDPVHEENENQEEEAVIVENSNLDLDSLVSSYTGLSRLYRLMFIADRCPGLREEALRLALTHVQTTCNVALYNKIHQKLHQAASAGSGASGSGNLPDVAAGGVAAPAPSSAGPGAALPVPDLQWIEAKSKKATLKLEKLDTDLKNSKVNSIKESIRRGHDDLGDHYLDCGELSNALKCYSRARDYCTSHMHILAMCLNVIKVSIYLQNWSHVLSYVSKALATSESTDAKSLGSSSGGSRDQTAVVQCKLSCAAGLAQLATRKYKSAAKSFLSAQLDTCEYSEVLSPWSVAVYGGLCALATYTRQELHKNVISSSSFKQFLELEPQLRDIIFKFYESKYAQCLKLLDDLKDVLLLDMYLASHVNALYSKIRNRGLVQYFSPYKSASLERMALAFNTSVCGLENELTALILDGNMQARIDSHNKIVYTACVEERSVTFERTLQMGQQHIDRLHLLILRAALMRQQMHVKPPSRDALPGTASAADGLGDSQASWATVSKLKSTTADAYLANSIPINSTSSYLFGDPRQKMLKRPALEDDDSSTDAPVRRLRFNDEGPLLGVLSDLLANKSLTPKEFQILKTLQDNESAPGPSGERNQEESAMDVQADDGKSSDRQAGPR